MGHAITQSFALALLRWTAALWLEDLCSVVVASRQALLQHQRITHRKHNSIKLWVDSSATCPVCKVVFGSTLRAIAHLADRRRIACSDRLHEFPQTSPSEAERLDGLDRELRKASRRQGRTTPLAPAPAIRPDGSVVGRACL